MEIDIQPEPPPIKKLGARSLRRIENLNSNEFVIKCALLKSLEISGQNKINLVQNLNDRIEAISKGQQRISFAFNIMIRECISKSTNPFDIVLPDFLFDNTLVRQIMTGLESSKKDIPELVTFLERNERFLPDVQTRYQGDRNSIVRASEQYITNFKTFLETTFKSTQNKFLYLWCERNGLDEREASLIRHLINGWDIKNHYTVSEKVYTLISFHRKILYLEKDSRISSVWIKKNYKTVIVYFSIISKYLEKHNRKAINLAPICKIRSKFLYIDTEVIYGILKELKIVNSNYTTFDSLRDHQWESIFKIKNYLTRKQRINFKFSGTIETDGIAVNFHFRRPKLPFKEKIKDSSERIIGVDPGRTTLFCGVEKINDTQWKKYTLSRVQFYADSGIKRATKNSNKWNLSIKPELDELSQTNTRSHKLSEFLNYTTVILRHYDVLWEEYLKKRHTRQRLKTYSGKKRTYDDFFKTLDDNSGRKLTIAYGDAGFASTSKYELSAPKTRLLSECKKWGNIEMIDEFRTSQISYDTGLKLAKVIEKTEKGECKYERKNKNRPKIGDVRSIRGLLWCCSTNKKGKFINRDINAAKNMVKCYMMYPKRPPGLNRKDKKQDDPNIKYIKNYTEEEGENFESPMWCNIPNKTDCKSLFK